MEVALVYQLYMRRQRCSVGRYNSSLHSLFVGFNLTVPNLPVVILMIECQHRQLLLGGWCIGLSYGLFFSSVSRMHGVMMDLRRCFLLILFSRFMLIRSCSCLGGSALAMISCF